MTDWTTAGAEREQETAVTPPASRAGSPRCSRGLVVRRRLRSMSAPDRLTSMASTPQASAPKTAT